MNILWGNLTIVASLVMIAVIVAYVVWNVFQEIMTDRAIERTPATIRQAFHDEIRALGDVPVKSYFLILKDKNDRTGNFRLPMPQAMDVHWLSGKTLSGNLESFISTGSCSIKCDDGCGEATFESLPIPRFKTRGGKEQNRYSVAFWMQKSDRIREIGLGCRRRDPENYLQGLLGSCGRLNAPFEWLWGYEPMKCAVCRKSMTPVVQIDGYALGQDPEAVIYIAACNCTPDRFKVVWQST